MSTLHRDLTKIDLSHIPDTAIYESWESIYEKTLELGDQIEEYCEQTGERFDKIAILPRGAYYIANILAREFNFVSDELLHLGIGSYKHGSTTRNGQFRVGQMPKPEEVKGQRLLMFDEVSDTGHTLKYAVDWLRLVGVQTVKTGVLHYKPEKSEVDYRPDWFVEETNEWVVYPWEPNESRGRLSIVHAKIGPLAIEAAQK